MITKLLSASIRWYQRNISAGLPRRCKYYPTCSQYAIEALHIHGPVKGTLLSVWRLMRCNPWSKGGVDFVPKKGQWPSKPMGTKELMAHRAKEAGESSDQLGHGDDATSPPA